METTGGENCEWGEGNMCRARIGYALIDNWQCVVTAYRIVYISGLRFKTTVYNISRLRFKTTAYKSNRARCALEDYYFLTEMRGAALKDVGAWGQHEFALLQDVQGGLAKNILRVNVLPVLYSVKGGR